MTISKKANIRTCDDKDVSYNADSKRAAILEASKDDVRWSKLELEKLMLINKLYDTANAQIGMGVHRVKGKISDRYEFANSTTCFRVYQGSAGKYVVARLA